MGHSNDNQVWRIVEFWKNRDDQIYMDHFEYIHQSQVFSIDRNLKEEDNKTIEMKVLDMNRLIKNEENTLMRI